jgi:hypothetical protein
LKGNKFISSEYILRLHPKEIEDLNNAIKKSQKLDEKFQKLEGIRTIIIYVYDSDVFKNEKKISNEINNFKRFIYFNEEKIEDFLSCYTARPIYKNRKPKLSRHIINEIKDMDIDFLNNTLKKPKRFKDFKSIHDLLLELFLGEL